MMKRLKALQREGGGFQQPINSPLLEEQDENQNTKFEQDIEQDIQIRDLSTNQVHIDDLPTCPDDLPTHPDGEWGYVVVCAAFLTQFIVVGLQNSSGVIFSELVETFNESKGSTGFVSSISCGMMFFLGPVTTALCQRFGCRAIAITGGLLCCLGMALSAHAPNLQIMYVTFGVIWGLGTSFCYFPTLIILVPYFNKKLALVNGIVSAGAGLGTLVLSPSIQVVAKEFGVKMMFYSLAAAHILVLLSGLLYRPLSDKYKIRQGIEVKEKPVKQDDTYQRQNTKDTLLSEDSSPTLDRIYDDVTDAVEYDGYDDESSDVKDIVKVLVELFQDRCFCVWCCALSVFMLGYFVPFVHLVRYAKLLGIEDVDAAFLISALSITATVFKILTGRLAGMERVNTLKLYQFGLLIMGVATTMIPVSHSYFGLVVYTVAFGISESCFIVMIPLITKDIVGIQRLPLALGCVFMLMGVPTVLGAPIAGWIYDAFQDYSYAFFVAGMMNIVGVMIMFLITYFKEEGHLHQKVLEEREKYREDKQKQEAATKTIVMTSFTSTERIYVSHRDLNNPFEERRRQPPLSKIIEFTSFASSERIYLSSRDVVNPYPSNNNVNKTQTDTHKLLPPANFPTPRIRCSTTGNSNRPESIAFGDHTKFEHLNNRDTFSPRKRPLSLQFEPKNILPLYSLPEITVEEPIEVADTTNTASKTSDVQIDTPQISDEIIYRPESPGITIVKKPTRVTERRRNIVRNWWNAIFKKTFPHNTDRVVSILDEKLIVDSRLTVV